MVSRESLKGGVEIVFLFFRGNSFLLLARAGHEFSWKLSKSMSQKREILIVQVEFGKIISFEWTELCFVNA